jgi:hypothetical protein
LHINVAEGSHRIGRPRANRPPRLDTVLINRRQTYTDLYLPLSAGELALVEAIDALEQSGVIAGDVPTLEVTGGCSSNSGRTTRSCSTRQRADVASRPAPPGMV